MRNLFSEILFIVSESRQHKLPLRLFLALCLNLAIAPIVYAASGAIERRQAWALGVLGIVTLALAIYLFDVVFRPERY